MSDEEFLPLEDNSALVRLKAEHYGQIANAIIRSVSTLTRIKDSSDMTSEAMSAIREKAGKVADDIEKARNRYSGTSKALIVYSHALRGAQDDANTAIAHINDKQHELAAAGSKAHTAKTAADAAADEDKATADKTADAADAAVASASHALSAATANGIPPSPRRTAPRTPRLPRSSRSSTARRATTSTTAGGMTAARSSSMFSRSSASSPGCWSSSSPG